MLHCCHGTDALLFLFILEALHNATDIHQRLGRLPLDVLDGIRRFYDHIMHHLNGHIVAQLLPHYQLIAKVLDQHPKESLTVGRGVGMVAPAVGRTLIRSVAQSLLELQREWKLRNISWNLQNLPSADRGVREMVEHRPRAALPP